MALVGVRSILLLLLLLLRLLLETTHGWTKTPSPALNRNGNIQSRRSWRRFLSTETKESVCVADRKSVSGTSRKKEADNLVSMVDNNNNPTKSSTTTHNKRISSLRSKSDCTKNVRSVSAASTWMDRVQELLQFSQAHGHTRVPKRYKENPALGNWVNKQRQLYRSYLQGTKPCSLTKGKNHAVIFGLRVHIEEVE